MIFYGAMLLESSQKTVCLKDRHLITDFTYKDNYLNSYVMDKAGPSLEHHEFQHIDCPITSMETSGHFVLAKFLNERKTKIAITGFKVLILLFFKHKYCPPYKVPTWHSLFTPSHVLHTNNYLRGTWRTMLSDQWVNEGKLERRDTF